MYWYRLTVPLVPVHTYRGCQIVFHPDRCVMSSTLGGTRGPSFSGTVESIGGAEPPLAPKLDARAPLASCFFLSFRAKREEKSCFFGSDDLFLGRQPPVILLFWKRRPFF